MPLIGHSNEDIDFALMGGVATAANVGFDQNLAKTAIQCNNTVTTESHRMYLTDQKWGGAARSSFRLQYAHRFEIGSFAGYTGQYIVFKSIATGLDLFRLAGPTGSGPRNMTLQYNSSSVVGSPTWVQIGATQVEPDGVHIHTFTVDINDTTGVLQWHRDGVLLASMSGDTLRTTATTIDCIAFWPLSDNRGFGGFNYWAHTMLGTVDYMTYGLQVANPAIDGAGGVATQDSGVYTDVNETILNRANGITLDTVGDGFSGTVANLAGAAATAPIMALRVVADCRRGSSGPDEVKLFVRIGGTNYYSPAIAVDGIGFVTLAYTWELNPATSAPWTVADFNAIEIGVEAA